MSKYKFFSEETSKQEIPSKFGYKSRKDLYDSTNNITKKTLSLIAKIDEHKEKYPLNVIKSESKYDDDPKLNDPEFTFDRTQLLMTKMQHGIPMDDDDDDYLNAMKNLQVKIFEPTTKSTSPIEMSQEDVQNYYNFIENEQRKQNISRSKRIAIVKKAAVTIISIGAVGGFLVLTANLTVPASIASSMFESGFYIEQLVKNKTMITFKIFTVVKSLEKGPAEFLKSLLRETTALTFLVTANSKVGVLGSVVSPDILGMLHIGPNSFLNYVARNTIQGTILNIVNAKFAPIAEKIDLETQMSEKVLKEKEEIELTKSYLECGQLKFEKLNESEIYKNKQKWFNNNKKAIIATVCASSVALAWLKFAVPNMQQYNDLLDKDKVGEKLGDKPKVDKVGTIGLGSFVNFGKEWAVQTFIVQKLLGVTLGYFNTIVDCVVAHTFKLIGKDQNSPLFGKKLANYFRTKFGIELLHQLTVSSILKNFFGFTFQANVFPLSQNIAKLSVEGIDFLATGKFDNDSAIKSLYDNADFKKIYNSVNSENLQHFGFRVYEETLKEPLLSAETLFSRLTNFTLQPPQIQPEIQPQRDGEYNQTKSQQSIQQSQKITENKAEEIITSIFGIGRSDPIFNDLVTGVTESGGTTTDQTVINALKQFDGNLRTLSLELNQLKSVTDYNSLFLPNINDHLQQINDMDSRLSELIKTRNDAFKQITNPVAQKADFQNSLEPALKASSDLRKNIQNAYKLAMSESKNNKDIQIKLRDMNEKKDKTLRLYENVMNKVNNKIGIENQLNLLSDVKYSTLKDLQGQINTLKTFIDGTSLLNYEKQTSQINSLLEKFDSDITKVETNYKEKLIEQQKYISSEYQRFTGKQLTDKITYSNAKELVKTANKLYQKNEEIQQIKNNQLEKSKELKKQAVFGRRILSSVRSVANSNEANKDLQNVYEDVKSNTYKIEETLKKLDENITKLDDSLNEINENINLLKNVENDQDIKAQLLFVKDDMLTINNVLDNTISDYNNLVSTLDNTLGQVYSVYYQLFANGKMPESNKPHDVSKNAEIEQDIQVRATRTAMKIGVQNLEKLSEQLNDSTIKNDLLKKMANKISQQHILLETDEIDTLDKLMTQMTQSLTEKEKSTMLNCFEGDSCRYMSGLDWTIRIAASGLSGGSAGLLNAGFKVKAGITVASNIAHGTYKAASFASGYEMFAGTKLQTPQDLINEINDWVKDGLVVSYVDFSTVLANQFVKQLSGQLQPGEITPLQYTAKFMNNEIGFARYIWNVGGYDAFVGTEYGNNFKSVKNSVNFF